MVQLEGSLLLSFCSRVLERRSARQWYVNEPHESHNTRVWREHTKSRREKVFHFLEHSANRGTRCKSGGFYLQEFRP